MLHTFLISAANDSLSTLDIGAIFSGATALISAILLFFVNNQKTQLATLETRVCVLEGDLKEEREAHKEERAAHKETRKERDEAFQVVRDLRVQLDQAAKEIAGLRNDLLLARSELEQYRRTAEAATTHQG